MSEKGFWSGAGGGLLSGIGAIGGGLLGSSSAKRAEAGAREARRWSSKMYRNRYRHTVNDLRKAGLNPMLAVAQGGAQVSGAPTSENTQALSSQLSHGMLQHGMTTGLDVFRSMLERKEMKSRIEQRSKENIRIMSDAQVNRVQAQLLSISKGKISSETALNDAKTLYQIASKELVNISKRVSLRDLDVKALNVERQRYINDALRLLNNTQTEILRGLKGEGNIFQKVVIDSLKSIWSEFIRLDREVTDSFVGYWNRPTIEPPIHIGGK